MSLPRIVGFAGSLRRPSKTRALVEAVGAEVTARGSFRLDVFDVIDAGAGLGSAMRREDLSLPAARIVDAIERADALIVGTPVYKGAYTGLFKHLFDFVEPQALAGKPVILTATGGGPRHALVVEHALRPLFGFFTALSVPTAVYASEADFEQGQLVEAGVVARLQDAAGQLTDLLERKTGNSQANWAAAPAELRVPKVVGVR